MRRSPTTPISRVCEICNVSPEAVRNAARLTGIPLFGNLIGKAANKLPEDFFYHVHDEHDMLTARSRRHATP